MSFLDSLSQRLATEDPEAARYLAEALQTADMMMRTIPNYDDTNDEFRTSLLIAVLSKQLAMKDRDAQNIATGVNNRTAHIALAADNMTMTQEQFDAIQQKATHENNC